MFKRMICFGMFFVFAAVPDILFAEQTLTAVEIDGNPLIDDNAEDPVWENAKALITHDKIADIDVSIRCVYNDKNIYFLMSYPDPDEFWPHKPWIWNRNKEIYEMGLQRENSFVPKWANSSGTSDLNVQSDTPDTMDIWFWKPCRTDPVDYGDDKVQILDPECARVFAANGRKGETH